MAHDDRRSVRICGIAGSWAVASIFGEAERRADLHAQLLQRVQPEDNLIYLGNFLGRGAAAATVHELLVFRRTLMARQLTATHGEIVYLRGSQEEMWHKLLQMQFAPNPREVLEWMLLQGVGPTLEAYGGTIEDACTAAKLGAVRCHGGRTVCASTCARRTDTSG